MASLNKVFLIGNLTRDPELRYTPSGAPVADLGLAINRVYTTKEGDRREEVTFIDVTTWNRQAENCCQYLKKGRPVHVEGYLKMDTWQDKTTGEKRSKIKIEAENVQFLGGRDDSGGGGGGAGGGASAREDDEYGAPPAPPRRPAPSGEGRGNYGNGNGNGNNAGSGRPPAPQAPPRRPAPPAPEAEDDDIPF